jgi:alpha-D-ribose 1-methylphosphonate 5-triphosphate synthase subunit PhnL
MKSKLLRKLYSENKVDNLKLHIKSDNTALPVVNMDKMNLKISVSGKL